MFNTHTDNNCLSAPGMAIDSSTAYAKYANTFQFKANGRVSANITTAQAPTLLGVSKIGVYPSGTAPTAGVLKNTFYRIYTLVATLPAATYVSASAVATATPTFTWLASEDYDGTLDVVNFDYAPMPDKPNQAAIGFLVCQNFSGSDFTPGTTALSAITTRYIDNVGTIAR